LHHDTRRPAGHSVRTAPRAIPALQRPRCRAAQWFAACIAGLLAAAASSTVRAETLMAMGGLNGADDQSGNTYAWEVEYQEMLAPHVAASFAWLNEGHFIGHYRDGAMAQIWLTSPEWHNRFRFSLGVGPYVYFDTEANQSTRGYSDVHGIGAVITQAMAYDLSRFWFVSLNTSETYAPGDVGTYAVMLGAGYRFSTSDYLIDALTEDSGSTSDWLRGEQQVQLFGGEKVFNDLDYRQKASFGADYRIALRRWAALSATWFDDPTSAAGRHDRLASQFWVMHSIDRAHLSLAVGLGPYVQLGAPPSSGTTTFRRVSGLSGLRADWGWGEHVSLIFTWYRKFTDDDEDRDIFALGVGWRFGER
jgi:hypothetical protein